MAKKGIIPEIEAQIERDRGILAVLKSGKLHVGETPELRGDGDRTQDRIIDLERRIAENKILLASYDA